MRKEEAEMNLFWGIKDGLTRMEQLKWVFKDEQKLARQQEREVGKQGGQARQKEQDVKRCRDTKNFGLWKNLDRRDRVSVECHVEVWAEVGKEGPCVLF